MASRKDQAALERFCDEWFAAWTGDDPERLLAYYAEDCAYADPARPQGLRGHAELRPYFVRLLGLNPDWVWTRKELHALRDAPGFVVRYEATIPLPGETLVERGMDLVLLDAAGARIARNDVYFDRARWLAKLGKPPR